MMMERANLNVASMWGREDIACDDPVLTAQIEREARLRIGQTNGHRGNGRVAAIVPNYNYGHYVEQAIDSLLAQTRKPNQIIVVDDASTDDSLDRLKKYKRKIKVIRHERNGGTVGATRNTGIQFTDAEFVVCLDSDDMLEPTYIETCYSALKADVAVGVAYTGVQTHVEPDGQRVVHKDWPIQFNWKWQTERKRHPNTCIPTASMFRRRMWERAGGYDGSLRAAEDAEYWVRALGTGYRAVKCTNEPLFVYRRHGASMSNREPIDLGWINPSYRGYRPLLAPTGQAPQFRDYTKPLVSVIVPVGPGHTRHVVTAIQSVVNQTLLAWELIVINNSGERLPIGAYPFVRLIELPKGAGVSRARNAGIKAAQGEFVFFLDADDAIQPQALEKMVSAYAIGDTGYIYSGWWLIGKNGEAPQELIAGDYNPWAWLSPDARGIHGVTVLAATEDVREIGGFDEAAPLMEDWEFFARCAAKGLCGKPVKEALLIYRASEGQRRREAQTHWSDAVDYIKEKFGEYIDGRKQIMGCCGGNANAVQQSRAIVQGGAEGIRSGMVVPLDDGNAKTVRFTGVYEAPVTYFGKYTGCKSCPPVLAANGDWQSLVNTGAWEVVEVDQPLAPQPALIYEHELKNENAG